IPGSSPHASDVLEQYWLPDAGGTQSPHGETVHHRGSQPTERLPPATDAGRSWGLSRKNAAERACHGRRGAPEVPDRKGDLREPTSLLCNCQPLSAENRPSALSGNSLPFGP